MGNSDKDFEKSNQCAFDAYCKVILRNEARDAYDQRKRKLKREQLFGEMSPEELNKLITTDRYFQFERDIVEDGLHFIVCDQGVYDALMTLPGAKRKIVLLSYFGEMNDREIGDALGTGRANVQYHRSRALAMMRKTLQLYVPLQISHARLPEGQSKPKPACSSNSQALAISLPARSDRTPDRSS